MAAKETSQTTLFSVLSDSAELMKAVVAADQAQETIEPKAHCNRDQDSAQKL